MQSTCKYNHSEDTYLFDSTLRSKCVRKKHVEPTFIVYQANNYIRLQHFIVLPFRASVELVLKDVGIVSIIMIHFGHF